MKEKSQYRIFDQLGILIYLIIITSYVINCTSGYLIVVNEHTEPHTIIFNASIYKLGSERHYKINTHKSAYFVHHLIYLNSTNGQVKLKKQLKCDGIFYPNLFTFYIDSTSNRLRSINYYSLPLRIFISGDNCNDEKRIELFGRQFEEEINYETENRNRRYRRHHQVDEDEEEEEFDKYRMYGEYVGNDLQAYIPEFPWIEDELNYTNYRNFREGDVLFDSTLHNYLRHQILNRKRRDLHYQLDQKLHKKIADAKNWISETYASYAIHATDKWNKICLKRSQFINSIKAFLPKTITQYCKVNFLDVSDERFRIEASTGDLVASNNLCIHETMWKVIITFNTRCTRMDLVDADHRLKIVYHHQELNDTDIAKRVKRELRNQSPYFEHALYVASVLEEQAVGTTVISTLRARDPEDSPVQYSMVSLLDSRSQAMFKIDSRSGVVVTATNLDRELMDVHYFRVIATDDSFPPRSGTTTLQVNVLDCNDHSPTFEAEQFEASIREDATIGTTVITLRSTDLDSGKNAEIEYAIERVIGSGAKDTTSEDDSQIFKIDSKTGAITTRSNLDRETSDLYTVVVTANDMASPQSERKTATATVLVKVLDANDNYPMFSERTYTVEVSEDQWGGNNVIAHITATDNDQGNNKEIRYAIIGGNTQSQFAIDSLSGDVTLIKPLDYESLRSYRLVIRAQDGGSPSKSNTTQLLVKVLDANDNAPRFYTSQFQETVLESVSVGYNIIRVSAFDADEGKNSEITYSIPDKDDNFPFTVDPRTGWIQTSKPLDREEQHRYSFQVLAVDGGIPPKQATTSVSITVLDVNDNNPTFNPRYYEAAIAEDQPPGTPVVTVIATDPDEDSRLHYEITSGNIRGRFSITSQNGKGLITIAQSLDFKQEKRFILTVTATDSGSRSDTATVNINVTDANNFAPMFENAPYTASVFEDAPLGTTVLVVSATDADVEIPNALITYSLDDESINGMGSSEPFSINPQTGAIITNAPLDRETKSAYLLTVTARDGGNPSLSDTTDVEITVSDCNDNAPTFKVPLYQASISEDALIGTSVTQISAEDKDIGLNGEIKYTLSQKDINDGSFVIDAGSGVIRTNKALDRESVAVYHLKALAVDKGSPPMSSEIQVDIRLEDVNDSPPTFPSDKITLYVPENSPIGTLVGEIQAHDPDEDPVIHYSIIGGEDSNYFSLVAKQGSEKAQILTMTELDFESSKKQYELIIRASSPPLRNDVHVGIIVTDVNDNAPILKDFQIIFNNFRDYFPSGIIGHIPAFDADVTDNLHYRILSGNSAKLLRLNSTSGEITLSPQLNTNVPKFATMEVSVSDGINEVKAIMQLIVRLVSEDMLFNSVTIRLNEMTEEAFLSPLLNFFLDGLAAIIPAPKENIFIFSIQNDIDVHSRILNVSFSAKRPDVAHEEFYSPEYLQERIYLNRAILARLATVDVLPFDDNICVREPCLNFEQCITVLKFGNASDFIYSDTVLFRPIHPINTFACICPEGFTGKTEHYFCDTEIDLCYSDPCQNNGTCLRREGSYTCKCQDGFFGDNCEKSIKAENHTNCANDLCDTGYSCMNSNSVPVAPAFSSTCELKARSFSKNSFLTFDGIKSRNQLLIKLKFATIMDNGLLLYNGRYNDKNDFIALEIIDGSIQFSYSLGDKIQTVSIHRERKLSDGEWHTVEVNYHNRTATLVIDNCDKNVALRGNLGERWNCANQTTLKLDKKCASLTESCHRFLDLTGPLQIGGLPRIPAHFQIQSKDYVGCISDLEINSKTIDLNSFVADNFTLTGCPEKKRRCDSNPCFNAGTCIEGWNGYTCDCIDGFSGENCQEQIPSSWRFSGNGQLSFNPRLIQIQFPWFNSLSIRTRQKNTFLMQVQVGQNSSAIIHLQNGLLHYSYNAETKYFAGNDLADGQWHRIEIKWSGNEVGMSVDYGQRVTVVPMRQKIHSLFMGKTVIGSPDNSIGNIARYEYYNGCVKDIRVGNYDAVLTQPNARENVVDGCSNSVFECNENCPHHSTCIVNWDEAYCECLPGYVGPDCVPICTVKPCADAGICRANTIYEKNYKCECNSTLYSGEYCELEHINVQGCPSGWWGERSCGPCKCNVKQGYHPDCHKQTGECRCRENHYQPENETVCLPCDCYSIGSFGGSCSNDGQCNCREGVIGRRCDSCSNEYAEVTVNGCEVVYDSCPKSFAAGVWWHRTPFGTVAIENCPLPGKGKGSRKCEEGKWGPPDMFNCTSEPFLELRKQLSQLEKGELELNTFVSVKMAANLQTACSRFDKAKSKAEEKNSRREYSLGSSFLSRRNQWNDEIEFDYLVDERVGNHDRLYGADLLITEGILHELIGYEIMQSGLNLSHSQDKDFIRNLIHSASIILDAKYEKEWKRLNELTQRGANDLVDAFNKYLIVLARSQQDLYTNPFELTHKNMAIGLDIVTSESLFGYEPQLLHDLHKNRASKANQYTTESVVIPDTSAFLQHSSKQKVPTISFPKYNNYMQDKSKFDRYSKILVPIDLLGIIPPEKDEISYSLKQYKAIIGYCQYKDVGKLFPKNFDETVTRRYGVDIEIASPVLSITILVPSINGKDKEKEPQKQMDRLEYPSKVSNKEMTNDIIQYPENIETKSEESFGDNFNAGPHLTIHLNDENFEPDLETTNQVVLNGNEPINNNVKEKFKRQVNDVADSENLENKMIYRSLGSPHLSQPVRIQMWLNMDKHRVNLYKINPQCVRFNTFTNLWTRIGCQTELPDYDNILDKPNEPILINCTCTHVSNYAVLIDIIDPEDIPEPSLLVQITSFSAFSISLPILFCVIIALALLRGMQTNSNTIHQNLLLCIFIAEFLFFVGIQSRKNLIENEFPCKLVAIGLHYFWLAAFAWMTVDCIHLYRMLTEMRDINHGPMSIYFTMGYGAPALLVGLSVGVRVHEYGNNMFCWLSLYENVIWWLVTPVSAMSAFNLLVLFISVKAAFTLKDHVLGFGNLRTLLWLSVVSLPLMGLIWVLSLLVASESSEIFSISLSACVLVHALFAIIGYCIINKRVRENLSNSFLRCMGKKVPLLDSSLVANSNSSQNGTPRTPGFGYSETARRNIGISVSSTTSRSTAKTSSRSDMQLRQTSTSTSNYNSDVPSFMNSYETHKRKEKRRNRRDSDSGSETDGRSLELASSHSSDDDESRVGKSSTANTHRSTGVTSFLPNITENVATTPPELNILQSPQLFPNIKPPAPPGLPGRWSTQAPESYLPTPVGRWSQDTGSDNEVLQTHKTSSPNPLPNPDLTDTSYLHQHQNKLNLPPSILENSEHYIQQKDYQDNYRDYHTLARDYSEKDYHGTTTIVNHMRPYHQDNTYLKESYYEKSRTLGYMGSRTSSPYLSKERIDLAYKNANGHPLYSQHSNHHSIQSLQRHADYHSDRNSEGSDKNGYHFPYTAEEDFASGRHVNDINNPSPVVLSRISSRHGTPPLPHPNNNPNHPNPDKETDYETTMV